MKRLVLLALTLTAFNVMATEAEPFNYPAASVSGKLGNFAKRTADGVDVYAVRCSAPSGQKGRVIAKVRTNIVGDQKPYGSIGVQISQGERFSAFKTASHPIKASPLFRESKWVSLEKIDCDKNFLLSISKRTFNEKNPKYISQYRTTFACQSDEGWIYPVSYKLVQNQ